MMIIFYLKDVNKLSWNKQCRDKPCWLKISLAYRGVKSGSLIKPTKQQSLVIETKVKNYLYT